METRKCLRCGAPMLEGFDIKVAGAAYGITLASSDRIFAERFGAPKVAVCPACGEISFYIENTAALRAR
ncbi:MAG: nucleic acid-binding protein [Oscillospiraceae bacterium]|nr:nucleic acid-binding protein [Oscillospiraceae bacterium]